MFFSSSTFSVLMAIAKVAIAIPVAPDAASIVSLLIPRPQMARDYTA